MRYNFLCIKVAATAPLMIITLNALTPIFILIALGYGLQRWHFPGDAFWPAAEKITYYLFFPCLLINKLATTDIRNSDALTVGLILLMAIIAAGLLCFLLKSLQNSNGMSFSSVFQGSIRLNTYIGFAISGSLYADAGIGLAAIYVLVMIPCVNVLSVLVLQHYAQDTANSLFKTLKTLASNPLILACLLGLTLNLSDIALIQPVSTVLAILGSIALPLGLLTVGAALVVSAVKSAWKPVFFSSVIKLVLLPLMTLSLCRLFEVSFIATQIAIIFTALPTATSSYILSRQMGGDSQLMAIIISSQTLLAFISIPIILKLSTGA